MKLSSSKSSTGPLPCISGLILSTGKVFQQTSMEMFGIVFRNFLDIVFLLILLFNLILLYRSFEVIEEIDNITSTPFDQTQKPLTCMRSVKSLTNPFVKCDRCCFPTWCTQRNIFEIILNHTKIRLYLPVSG